MRIINGPRLCIIISPAAIGWLVLDWCHPRPLVLFIKYSIGPIDNQDMCVTGFSSDCGLREEIDNQWSSTSRSDDISDDAYSVVPAVLDLEF